MPCEGSRILARVRLQNHVVCLFSTLLATTARVAVSAVLSTAQILLQLYIRARQVTPHRQDPSATNMSTNRSYVPSEIWGDELDIAALENHFINPNFVYNPCP